jgi:hypothetical protein
VIAKVFQLAKEPLLQFLLIGACIYGAYAWFGAADETTDDLSVVVDAARIQGFVTAWESRYNRPPTAAELDGLINQFIREDILYREATAMGLGEDDPITRRRLAQKLEFLTKDVARLKEPVEGELEAYFEANQSAYRAPDLITFSHIFIDPDKREDTTLGDAEALLAQLKSQGEPDADTLTLGDRFMLQNYYPQKTELEIRKQFGSGFSEVVMGLAPGQWHGPVLSGYGVHLVYVSALQQSPPPAFADVQDAVFADWQAGQQAQFNEEFFQSLKSRYEIVVEDAALTEPAS